MKFPKNRANLYLVVRETYDYSNSDKAVLGAFSDCEEADNFKDACQQEWLDKVGDLKNVDFEVELTTYYG